MRWELRGNDSGRPGGDGIGKHSRRLGGGGSVVGSGVKRRKSGESGDFVVVKVLVKCTALGG